MDILPSPVTQIFLLFYWHKTLIILKKKSEEKIKLLKPECKPSLQPMSVNNPTTQATGPTAHIPKFIHGSRVEIVPNLNLMAQCNLLLTPKQAFPVQPTANDNKMVKI